MRYKIQNSAKKMQRDSQPKLPINVLGTSFAVTNPANAPLVRNARVAVIPGVKKN
jgi:hypothetical protein